MSLGKLPCGHPAGCLGMADYKEPWCEWCTDTNELASQVRELTKALEGKAVFVNGGSPTIEGDVAYLVVNSGTVCIGKCGEAVALATIGGK